MSLIWTRSAMLIRRIVYTNPQKVVVRINFMQSMCNELKIVISLQMRRHLFTFDTKIFDNGYVAIYRQLKKSVCLV